MQINTIDPDEKDEDNYPANHREESEEPGYRELDDELDEHDRQMRRYHPGHSDKSYNAGRFLGVDFPYVPGDPDF